MSKKKTSLGDTQTTSSHPQSDPSEHPPRRRKPSNAERIETVLRQQLSAKPTTEVDPAYLAALEGSFRRRLMEAGVESRYLDANLHSIGSRLPADFHALATRLLQMLRAPELLAIVGNFGTGKTWLASALVIEFMKAEKFALYRSVDLLQPDILNAGFERRDRIISRLKRVNLLVLDEYQELNRTQMAGATIEAIVNDRYMARRATLLISNLLPAAFDSHIGPWIHRRLVEEGGTIRCTWGRIKPMLEDSQISQNRAGSALCVG